MDKSIIKEAEILPIQVHLDISAAVILEDVYEKILALFPICEKSEIKNNTIYLYEPNEEIEFIHISNSRVGIIFNFEAVLSEKLSQTWGTVNEALKLFEVDRIEDITIQIRNVYPFKTKEHRNKVAKKISPIAGFEVSKLTLHKGNTTDSYVDISMVSRGKSKGVMISCVYEDGSINLIDSMNTLQRIFNHYTASGIPEEVIKGLLKDA